MARKSAEELYGWEVQFRNCKINFQFAVHAVDPTYMDIIYIKYVLYL